MNHKTIILALGLLTLSEASSFAQETDLQRSLSEYLSTYQLDCAHRLETCRLESVAVDDENHVVRLFANAALAAQSYTPARIEALYADLRRLLPEQYRDYRLMVFANRIPLEQLTPRGTATDARDRQWHDVAHRGNAWVTPLDRCYHVGEGLEDRHISLWASHGRYYSQQDGRWMWQRPNLFCTCEDLLSQSIVVPLLIPMLENAGAVVFSPRERDWQRCEVIVDNDTPREGGSYAETSARAEWQDAGTGFAHLRSFYLDGDNPFADGTARMTEATHRRQQPSTATWTPAIADGGRYAVYVSYATLPTSVPDATYTVCHRGIKTRFRVNQQMGGSTWVYLGTFDFGAADPASNYVSLSSLSNFRGHVTADAVRFGGGMGNIARGDSTAMGLSGLPRCLEGARYYAQWAGMPHWLYAGKGGVNDYAEDINTRSYMTNYLASGSAYVPADTGLHVPIEMSIALHTDAGYTTDSSRIGSLAIYTTDFNEGRLATGLSRLTSRDLADGVMTQVRSDLSTLVAAWPRRQLWDRNYSETREPAVPSAIFEMLSHQNFDDLRLAHDPTFKFHLARAIYKGILRFLHNIHDEDEPIVQPLPVTAPAAVVAEHGGEAQITVTWKPVLDALEPTAEPAEYIVYHAIGTGGFDNGTATSRPSLRINNPARGTLHRFRITAANAGGQSLPSEEVCAYVAPEASQHILVVDAFRRMAGPQLVQTPASVGFDMSADPGAPIDGYPGYCGAQQVFSPFTPHREGAGAFGFSGSELEGLFVAGNSHDWTSRHAADIVAATDGRLHVSSCTVAAMTDDAFDSRQFRTMDIAFGLERNDGYSLLPAKVFDEGMRQAVSEFTRGGGSVLVSGAYVATDMRSDDERLFTRQVLKYEYAGALRTDSVTSVDGLGQQFRLVAAPNERCYAVPQTDCLAPVAATSATGTPTAFCTMTYAPTSQSAAVAYAGESYRSLALGFPIEAVTDDAVRGQLWRSILQFLMP